MKLAHFLENHYKGNVTIKDPDNVIIISGSASKLFGTLPEDVLNKTINEMKYNTYSSIWCDQIINYVSLDIILY